MDTLYSDLAFRLDPDDHECFSYLDFDPESSSLEAFECGSNQTPMQRTLDSANLTEWLSEGDSAEEPSTAVTDVSWHTRILFCRTKVAPFNKFPWKEIDMLWHGAKVKNTYRATTLSITIEDFKCIMSKFNLPKITPWLLVTRTAQFRRYEPDPFGVDSQWIGITMTRMNYGLIPMGFALAVSHDTSTGRTQCIVFTDSDGLIQCTIKQLSLRHELASNPLLVPSLIQTYIFITLESLMSECWDEFLIAEHASGQAPKEEFSFGVHDSQWGKQQVTPQPPNKLSRQILRINQLLGAYQQYLLSGLLAIERMQETLQCIQSNTSEGRRKRTSKTSAVIAQHLRSLCDTGKAISLELHTMKDRVQALNDAIHNYVNAALASDTREITAASKRDSTAMKGLAVVTMFFLPGTFFAAVFATPFFSLSPQDHPKLAPSFWIFCACVIPVTITVFVAYTIWFSSVTGENNRTAKDARGNFHKPFEFPIMHPEGRTEQI